jgi:hypothetical protein
VCTIGLGRARILSGKQMAGDCRVDRAYYLAEMGNYSLETGETVWHITCRCCGRKKSRVIGFVCNDLRGHGKYYALLNVEEKSPRVGLTISVGSWSDRSPRSERTPLLETELPERSWAHLDVRLEGDGAQMDIRNPDTSPHYPWEKGGAPITPEDAKISNEIQEIWEVANFVVSTDPAISSYLHGMGVDATGRQVQDGVHPARCC